MLLTESSGWAVIGIGLGGRREDNPAGRSRRGRSLGSGLGAGTRGNVLLALILFRTGQIERHQLLVLGRDPVADGLPLVAFPLDDQDLAVTLVVVAAELDRLDEALQAQLDQAVLGQVEVLEAPAGLLAVHDLVAELLLGSPQCL